MVKKDSDPIQQSDESKANMYIAGGNILANKTSLIPVFMELLKIMVGDA